MFGSADAEEGGGGAANNVIAVTIGAITFEQKMP